MPREITMAVIAVVMLMFPAFASSNDNRGKDGIYQLAQYCVPQYDELADMTRVYC